LKASVASAQAHREALYKRITVPAVVATVAIKRLKTASVLDLSSSLLFEGISSSSSRGFVPAKQVRERREEAE
jgi:hypothetical protein